MIDLTATSKVIVMPNKRYTPEEILQHLRAVEPEAGKGLAIFDACRTLGITKQTYYRWKKEYCGWRVDQATGSDNFLTSAYALGQFIAESCAQ